MGIDPRLKELRPGRVAKRLVRAVRGDVGTAPYVALSTTPLVIHVKDWAFGSVRSPVIRLIRRVGDMKVYVLYTFSQYIDDTRVTRLAGAAAQLAAVHDGVRIIVLAPTGEERDRVLAHGYRAIHCSENAFVDESVFRPLAGIHRSFDAVYDAKLVPFKRHELAAEIDNLALITYLQNGRVDDDYRRLVEEQLTDAHWFNDPFAPGYRKLGLAEVNTALNRCRVGLCLSAREGPMMASIQYLLAGLPVVSTESLGGRAEFFHPDYVTTAAADPAEIAAAVRSAMNAALPGDEIRSRTLNLVAEHRSRLFELMDHIFSEHGITRPFRSDWPRVHRHGLFDPALAGPRARSSIADHNQQIIEAAKSGRPLPARPPSS